MIIVVLCFEFTLPQAQEQFAAHPNLSGGENLIGGRGFQCGDGIRLVIPIVETVVEPDLEPVLAGGRKDLRHKVAPRSTAVSDVEIQEVRRERRKPSRCIVVRTT